MAVLMPIADPPGRPGDPGVAGVDRGVRLDEVVQLADRRRTVRPSALTIPVVTVWLRPNGLPTAIVMSPTCTSASAPRRAAELRRPRLVARMTAVSMDLSTATTSPETVVPSWSLSVTVLDRPTTCDAVRIRPHRPPRTRTRSRPGLDLDDRGQQRRGRSRQRLIGGGTRPPRRSGLRGRRAPGELAARRCGRVRALLTRRGRGPDHQRGAHDEPASWTPRGARRGQAGQLHRPSRTRAAVGQTSGGVGGRSRQLLCGGRRRRRDRPRSGASGSRVVMRVRPMTIGPWIRNLGDGR
jgi:hypothetical protein